MDVTAVVLAAGRGQRMGGQKLTLPLRGVPMLGRVLATCAHLPTVVVISPELRDFIEPYGVGTIVNEHPERGMTYSLQLANAAIDRSQGILVLLGDKPLITAALVERILAQAEHTDVCYPNSQGVGGHPVFFSAHARTLIDSLPLGDTIMQLRDNPLLRRDVVECGDIGAYADIDTATDLDAYGAS